MNTQTTQNQETVFDQLKGHSMRNLIESNVYVKNDRYRYIKILNSESNLLEEFIYLGFTKTGNPKFGQIVSSDPNGIKIQKRIGELNGKYLSVMGDSFLKSIDEMRGGCLSIMSEMRRELVALLNNKKPFYANGGLYY